MQGCAISRRLQFLDGQRVTQQAGNARQGLEVVGAGLLRREQQEYEFDTLAVGRIEAREDRDRIQNQIMQLLTEVNAAAEGDLTVQAAVTSGELGSVADSFNFMIGELRQMEREGYLASTWEPGPTGPARRVYTLTDAGRGYIASSGS